MPLDGCPIKRDGKTLIPKCALELLNVKYGDSLICIDGVNYARLDAITDICSLENEMGLIFFDSEPINLTVENDIKYMLELAHGFIFEIPFGKLGPANSYAPATPDEREGFVKVGNTVRELLLKRNNTHPFLFASKEIFDRLREIYNKADGSDEYKHILALIEEANRCFTKHYPSLNENKDGLCEPMTPSGYGETEYDVGGRHSNSEAVFVNLMREAFAYQITHDETYAKHTYYCALGVIDRLHWGPGHMLNCSGATSRLAIIYDWLYDGWCELGLDTRPIKDAIYRKGLLQGFNSVILDNCEFPSPKQGTGWRFKAKNDNWNSVCNNGMIVGSLCLLNDGIDDVITEERYEKITELLGGCLTSTMQPHYVFKQYAPDGSYVESNSYWSYGTCNLIDTMAALYDSLGTDLGLHNGCGFDKTCYYAINAESAEYVGWNYHDGGTGSQSTSCFYPLATVSGDNMLYAIRKSQIEKGKSATPFDLTFHPRVRLRDVPELDAMPLDYAMMGIDAFTVRNGWERGSLYAGMIGGENPSGASHAQLDSGSFVYHNLGKLWITDLGSDYYNSRGIKNGLNYFANYGLYRRNAEGNNCLCLTSLPFGQLLSGRGYMTEHKSSDTASYCIIDNRSIYGEDKVEYARRGMLLTNNRRTLVIKDEVKLVSEDTAFTTAHFESDKITAELSADGKKCTLTHKDGDKIYVSVWGDGRLEIMNCTDTLLDGTAPAEGEYSRDNYSRLVIKHENVTELNTAFIIDTEDALFECPDLEMWKTL